MRLACINIQLQDALKDFICDRRHTHAPCVGPETIMTRSINAPVYRRIVDEYRHTCTRRHTPKHTINIVSDECVGSKPHAALCVEQCAIAICCGEPSLHCQAAMSAPSGSGKMNKPAKDSGRPRPSRSTQLPKGSDGDRDEGGASYGVEFPPLGSGLAPKKLSQESDSRGTTRASSAQSRASSSSGSRGVTMSKDLGGVSSLRRATTSLSLLSSTVGSSCR